MDKDNTKEAQIRQEDHREITQLLSIFREEGRKRNTENPNDETFTLLLERESRTQKEILETLKEFKFEYLDNEEKARKKEETIEEPIDYKEEFRAIHSENLVTIKRVMSYIYRCSAPIESPARRHCKKPYRNIQ
jgi:hypothetical protein